MSEIHEINEIKEMLSEPDPTSDIAPRVPKAKKRKLPWLIVGAVLAVLLTAYVGFSWYLDGPQGLYPRLTILGEDYRGLSEDEALARLNEALRRLQAGDVAVLYGEEVARFSYDELGVVFDKQASLDWLREQYEKYGDHWVLNGWRYFCSRIEDPDGVGLLLNWSYSREKCAEAASAVAAQLDRAPVDFSWTWDHDAAQLTLTRARDGFAVDQEDLTEKLTEACRNAAETGQFVVLRYSEPAAVSADLAAVQEAVCQEKINAAYDVENQCVTAAQEGIFFELAALEEAYAAAREGETFVFAVTVEQPDVTQATLERCLFRDVLSSYTTHAGGTVGRRTNVRLAAEYCTDTILNAGDVFDYTTALGSITAARGFQPAPGYRNGKTVDMTGGGVCQVSSTIYAAALYANLEIVTRTNHGYASSYIGLGLDATVASSGPQFQFRNDTLYPIRVECVYNTKTNDITVTLYGTKTDDTYVEMETEILSKTDYEIEYKETDTLPKGTQQVEQTAYTGYDVKTYRKVYRGDGTLLSSTLESRSRYKSRNKIILVGTYEEPASAVEETLAPSESGGTGEAAGETPAP